LDRLVILTAANKDLLEDVRFLEAELTAADRVGECDTQCRNLDLCGRCILFVGGRNRHIPHFRRFVEDSGGIFSHHDGGIEESISRLHWLCGRADAVFFPTDCISHRAQDEIKQLCRRWDKTLVPLRRTGLGAFIRALEVVAMKEPEGEEDDRPPPAAGSYDDRIGACHSPRRHEGTKESEVKDCAAGAHSPTSPGPESQRRNR
jgi:hypothetical protein